MQAIESLSAYEEIVRPFLRFADPESAISPEDNLGELGLDSLASIELLVQLEEVFDVTIQDELITENSFGSLVELQKLIEGSRV
ncbi:MAG: phosphopantetheine-binding protein [Verrucomicrobiota bacterium]